MADDNSDSPELPEETQPKWWQVTDALTRQDELLEAILLQLQMMAVQPPEPMPPPSEPPEPPVIPPGIEPKLDVIAEEQTRTKQLLEGFNFITGQATVQMAGTSVEVVSTVKTYLVVIRADINNAGSIYVGTKGVSATTGYILDAGEALAIPIDNLKKAIWVDAANSGDGCSWIALVD
jgi:hypothetical protein